MAEKSADKISGGRYARVTGGKEEKPADRSGKRNAYREEGKTAREREYVNADVPPAFLERMKRLLGDEYAAFLDSFGRPAFQALRLNPLRERLLREPEELARLTVLFGLRRVSWAREGYYYDGGTRPGRHPYHDAGLYYIQEPSAMAVAELLDPQPGERILDLCAAPGGKSTQIAGRMMGSGLLVSNEIHPARARILSQNIERFGAGNVLVTNEDPDGLARRFPEFFDRILVDAPCSGEGMFRKDEAARDEWSPDNVRLCAQRQDAILDRAADMLCPGGRLVYSTCTFAPEEDEGSVQRFLERHRDFSVVRIGARAGLSPGRPEWIGGGRAELTDTFRIWPHLSDGEGHYAAVLAKAGPEETESFASGTAECACRKSAAGAWEEIASAAVRGAGGKRAAGARERAASGTAGGIDKNTYAVWKRFCADTFTAPVFPVTDETAMERMIMFGGQLYLLPEGAPDLRGLKVLRPGLHLGTVKKERFEPSHALALYVRPELARCRYDMTASGTEIAAYLRGETIRISADGASSDEAAGYQNGVWTLMTVDGYPIGWSKRVDAALKNHYPKGLRRV